MSSALWHNSEQKFCFLNPQSLTKGGLHVEVGTLSSFYLENGLVREMETKTRASLAATTQCNKNLWHLQIDTP